MLEIREEQMRALRDAARKDLPRCVLIRLRETCPVETGALADEDLLARIEVGSTRGAGYGLDAISLERFLVYVMRHGEAFGMDEETAWAARLLADNRLTPVEKMNEIDRVRLSRG